MNKKTKTSNLIIHIVLSIICVIFVFPILIMIFDSLKSAKELSMTPAPLFPRGLRLENYLTAFNQRLTANGMPYLLIYLLNTVTVVVLSLGGMLLAASFCAYGFAKLEFAGKKIVFAIVLATVMVPNAVMMIPLYTIFSKLGWLNTLLPLWVPIWFGGGAFNIFLIRQFMKTIPNELIESATIEGSNTFGIFFKIILPNCKPILSVVAIQHFLATWNDLMGPLLYTNTEDKWTLALGIASLGQGILGNTQTSNFLMAACALMSIVPLFIFAFGQKYIVDNIVITGMKN